MFVYLYVKLDARILLGSGVKRVHVVLSGVENEVVCLESMYVFYVGMIGRLFFVMFVC